VVPALPVVALLPDPTVGSFELSIVMEVAPFEFGVVGPGLVFRVLPSVFASLAESVLLFTLSSGLVHATEANKNDRRISFFIK
jgi:hypothetical protein